LRASSDGGDILNQPATKRANEAGDNTATVSIARSARYRAARYATGAAVGLLYFWIIGIGAVSERFAWDSGLDAFYGLPAHPIKGSDAVNGYYDLLGRSFAKGRVRLPLEPSSELLALPDPWSDQINRPFRLLDTVLYRGHYYLYHGAAPGLLLFAPWYLLTGHDLPENFAAFLLSFGAYLMLAALFTGMLSFLAIRLPLGLYSLALLALGLGQAVPFLLHRVKVYEVAIACGYFCLSSGFYLAFRLLTAARRSVPYAALSGMFFGLAIGCRPHLGLASAPVFVLLLLLPGSLDMGARRFVRRDVFAFVVPLALCGVAVAAYNYSRFGNPLEFGTRYLLGADLYRNFHASGANLLRGLYYLVACPPDLVAEFPFLRLALRGPFNSPAPPADYFLEPIAGALSLCPVILLAPVMLIRRKPWIGQRVVRGFLSAMFVGVTGILLVLASLPFTSQRYEVDFVPYFLFIACVATGALWHTLRRAAIRVAAATALAALFLYCIAANLALAIQGPYDQFVQASPGTYVSLARWFSPVERFRPLLNPRLRVRAIFEFREPCPPRKEALLSAGEFGSRYLLSAECAGPGRIRLTSETSVMHPDVRSVDLPLPAPGRHTVGLDFDPESRFMSVSWNEQTVLQHPLRFLVTARSQIRLGWDPTLGNQDVFDGRILFPQIRLSADARVPR